VRTKDQKFPRQRLIDSGLLARLKDLPTAEVASSLGLVLKHNKAMCFNGHDSKSPSFTISQDGRSWKCYGCNEFGDSISLAQKILSLDFKKACQWLCTQFHIRGYELDEKPPLSPSIVALPKKTTTQSFAHAKASNAKADPAIYEWLISNCQEVQDARGVRYLESHGISEDIAKKFGLVELNDPKRAFRKLTEKWGLDRLRQSGLVSPKGWFIWFGYAIIFPFKEGESIPYMQARCFESKAKFIGPTGIPKPIYNKDRLKTLKPNQAVHICEGVPDALALEGMGLPAIGILGASSFREEWVEELLGYNLVGVPDGDAAGELFKKFLKQAFSARGKALGFLQLPPGLDASDVISRIRNDELS
jgi:DNA primase